MRLRVEKRLFSALYSLVQMRVYPPYHIGAKEFRSVTILAFRHIYFTDSRKTIWRNCFVVPRARQDGIGFGQANIWYAGTPECSEYVNKVIRYIESHA